MFQKLLGSRVLEDVKLMDALHRQKQFLFSDALKNLPKGQWGLKNGHQDNSEIKVAECTSKRI